MRSAIASIFRLLFRLSFFRKRYYGFHKRLFFPFKLFKGVKKSVTYFGVQLDLQIDDWIQENIYFLNDYERAELTFIKNNLQPSDVFVDIGANIGVFSLVANQCFGQLGAVISFEAFGKTYEHFLHHIKLNKATNIAPHQIAIADTEKEIQLFYDDVEANSGMVSTLSKNEEAIATIAAVSLDNYLDGQKVNFIKIDIEGGEFDALKGMTKTLEANHPTLLIELEDELIAKTNYTKKDVFDFLAAYDYTQYFLTDEGEYSNTETNPSRKNYIFLHDKELK